jgi:hypothetical protein
MQVLGELRRRGVFNLGLLRQYLRHAPEFRALKELLRYDTFRRIVNGLRKPVPS